MSSISARKRAGGRGSAGPKEEHDGLQERARRRTGASGQGGHMVRAREEGGLGPGREYLPERGGAGVGEGGDGPRRACPTAPSMGRRMKSHKKDLLYNHPGSSL
jgi:hypothetical protein